MKPATNPRTGAIVSTAATPSTPTGWMPSNPPQFTASSPPTTRAGPTSPPSSACPELDGRPRCQVMTFHVTAPVSAAPRTGITSFEGTVTMPAIVLATAVPSSSGPTTLPHRGEHHGLARAGRSGRDQRGDRVRRIVNPVRERERQRHRDRDDEPCVHRWTPGRPHARPQATGSLDGTMLSRFRVATSAPEHGGQPSDGTLDLRSGRVVHECRVRT